MMKHVAVSAMGKDRPGIVAAVAKALYDTGCNIEDSTMTLLGSEFALIVIAALPPKLSLPKMSAAVKAAGKPLGLTFTFRPLEEKEVRPEKPAGLPYMIAVYGADRPGIVYQVSAFLAEQHINITDVQTRITHQNERPVYVMFLEVAVPGSGKQAALQKKLVSLGKNLDVTISITPVESTAL